jgi:hypothetical protein
MRSIERLLCFVGYLSPLFGVSILYGSIVKKFGLT